jgi:argininosuccinate lyase
VRRQLLADDKVPFRETHHISGRVVALAEQQSCQISDLSFEQLVAVDKRFTGDVMGVFDYEASVEKRDCIGGPARARIVDQVEYIRGALQA